MHPSELKDLGLNIVNLNLSSDAYGQLLSSTLSFLLPGYNIYCFLIWNSFDFLNHSGHSSWKKLKHAYTPFKGIMLKEN